MVERHKPQGMFYGDVRSQRIYVVGATITSKSAMELLEAYHFANSQKEGDVLKGNMNNIIWEAPDNDFVKVNWDVVVDKHRRKMGIGVIVRDGMGEVLATLLSPRDHITEPDVAKAIGALRAVHL